MKKNMIKWIVLLMSILLLSACGGAGKPDKAVNAFYKNFKSAKYSNVSETIVNGNDYNPDRVIKEFDSLGKEYVKKVKDIKYKVIKTEEKDETAVVTVDVKYVDLKPYYDEIVKNILEDVKVDEDIRNISEDAEQLKNEIIKRMTSTLNAAGKNIPVVEKSIDVRLKKVEKKWKVEFNNTELLKSISANLYEA